MCIVLGSFFEEKRRSNVGVAPQAALGTCATATVPLQLCVLWLCGGFVLLKCAHLSLTRSRDPHRPLSHTRPHTHPYIPDGQITEHGKAICTRGSITHKHRHPTFQGHECFRSLFLHLSLSHVHPIKEPVEATCCPSSVLLDFKPLWQAAHRRPGITPL